jgi:NADH:ubiquinone oxidoreductase subunit 6 (subunit J)
MVFTAVSTDWRLIPDSEQERSGLVQTHSVNRVPEAALEQAGVSDSEEGQQIRQAGIADLLISEFVLPFEVASVLLLAALIGALALARGREGA